MWVFLGSATLQQPLENVQWLQGLHGPGWVTRKNLPICPRPDAAQNSSQALLLLAVPLSPPLSSWGFSS